ncbi:MAG: DNA polymerase III subunit alpha [Deltaproteobacteria bacterium]|jgi:DNA polymerase-3 subunit alpha|nr:DNA polymerase III subunit alpha [Deltaproteobacteria bacterium]
MSFVHLHVHSCYSLLDGAIKIKDLVKTTKAMGMSAVALTDHGQMFGIWSFYNAAVKEGIKPILGVEAYVTNRSISSRDQTETRHHLVLLAKNLTGYRNLCQIISTANIEGFYNRPRVDIPLLRRHSEGLIALSGCLQGEIPKALVSGREAEAKMAAERFAEIFPNSFYLEVQENLLPAQSIANQALAHLAKTTGLPLVATNDCHYLLKEHYDAHDILLCIQTGKKLTDEKRMKMESNEYYFKSPQKMAEDFAWCPEALANTMVIADQCQVEFPEKTYLFPSPPSRAKDNGASIEQIFAQQAREGLEKRFIKFSQLGKNVDDKVRAEYSARLEEEIAIINKMRFPGYFLIVSDFIDWAKKKGIPVGPGRGSAVGSLVAYCLGITDIDPIRFDLLFERFLNPQRKSMPDIDVDFCAEGRGEVIRYVTETYGGSDYVAQIMALGQMKAKAVVRDVGRVLGIEYGAVDAIAKMIPNRLGITLAEAINETPALRQAQSSDLNIKKLLEYALLLENLPRHSSIHASGVVVGDRPLWEVLPLFCESKSPEKDGRRTQVITQFELGGVEENGLVKFDFLGLKTLTLIRHSLRILAERGVNIDIERLDYGDKETFELLGRGDVSGVFQLENEGIREVVMRLKPDCLEDIIALVALYRPGPLKSGMVDTFIKVKHGLEEASYELEDLVPILKETSGVILYQEQVMRIAQVLAGYSLGEADILRRAMGKKKPDEMNEQKSRFVQGATQRGIPTSTADRIFELISKFAEYGFNKSHSAAYGVITYQTAWLKTHYPLEFMAALMTSEQDNRKKISRIMGECRRRGINVCPPDVNTSNFKFTVSDDKIIFGLGAIKGLGQSAIEAIIEARKDKPCSDLYDFCQKASSQKVNRRVIECLIKCGAFDRCGGAERPSLLAALDDAMAVGVKSRQKKQKPVQMSLFASLTPPSKQNRVWPVAKAQTEAERLAWEKELLGFYVTGDPLSRYEAAMVALRDIPLGSVEQLADNVKVKLCGTLTNVQFKESKNGKPYAFATLEDSEGSVEIAIWNNVLSKSSDLIENDRVVVVSGVIENNSNEDKKYRLKLKANEILDFEQALESRTASLTIDTSLNDLDKIIEFLASQTLKAKSETVKPTSLATIYLSVLDGLGRAVYRLDQQLKLSVDFFQEAQKSHLLDGYTVLKCSDSAFPFN